MHCEPVSVVSEWVCVGVCVYVQLCFRAHMYYVLCKCMYNVCVCMWVDVWTHALYQGSFCSLKSQWASVDAEPAGNHGNTSLPWLCHSNVQNWQAVWILGENQRMIFQALWSRGKSQETWRWQAPVWQVGNVFCGVTLWKWSLIMFIRVAWWLWGCWDVRCFPKVII